LRGHALTYLADRTGVAKGTGVLRCVGLGGRRIITPALQALVWLGTVSYAAYLWNYPLTLWLRPHPEHGAGLLAAALTVVMAALSWYAVERRFQRPRRPAPALVAA
jgi:peptidoglycan/LPS O-acetylase OafA/YrhL